MSHRLRRICSLSLAAVAVFVLGSSEAAAAPGTLSEQTLLTRLTDPAAQLLALPAGGRITQVSSHDLTGGNVDGGSYSDALGELLPHTYVRTEGGAYVLADESGPGCVVRLWMTAGTSQTQGDPSSFGNLQLFFDGRTTPAVNEPVGKFFAGQDSRFPRPLVNDYLTSSGGNYSYIPFCFARRLVVRVTGALATSENYFQLTFLHAASGTPLQTFNGDGTAIAQAGARALGSVGKPPSPTPSSSVTGVVGPGGEVSLPTLTAPGAVRYLRFAIKPFDIETLNALSLRIAVDGSRHPQVDVPLADVFGDGLELRPIKSLDFGMDPSSGTGYLALPVPYGKEASISVASSTASARVSLGAWTGAPARTGERLYGEQLVTQTQIGQDFPVLEASGSGHLASYVMDVTDASAPLSGNSGGQWFMEGDERVYVDGARSPSIYGTGTEDEFDGGYYFNQGPFSLPFNGAGPLGKTGTTQGGTQSAYRIYGDDGVIWSDRLDYGQQAGGDNERPPETAVATTFSYRGAPLLSPADSVRFGDPAGEAAHHLTGTFSRTSLDAYFEGNRDGTIPVSTLAFGGTYYPSPPPQASGDSYSARGIAFRDPISVTLRVPASNHGVVLRRLQDQNAPAPVEVTVDGEPVGVWPGAPFQGNPSKRWLESDYELPATVTAGHSALVVTLAPTSTTETATAYSLQAFMRRST